MIVKLHLVKRENTERREFSKNNNIRIENFFCWREVTNKQFFFLKSRCIESKRESANSN